MRSVDPHFMPDSKLTKKDLLFEERTKGETSICPECGQEYWVKWYVGIKFTQRCARCYFKHHKV